MSKTQLQTCAPRRVHRWMQIEVNSWGFPSPQDSLLNRLMRHLKPSCCPCSEVMLSCLSWLHTTQQAGPGEPGNASWRNIWRSSTPACLKQDDHHDQIRSARAKSWKTSGRGAAVHFCCRGRWDGWTASALRSGWHGNGDKQKCISEHSWVSSEEADRSGHWRPSAALTQEHAQSAQRAPGLPRKCEAMDLMPTSGWKYLHLPVGISQHSLNYLTGILPVV